MDENSSQISKLAEYLRNSTSSSISTFSISTNLWSLLMTSLELLDEEEQMSSSFHIMQSNNIKAEFMRELKFLLNFITTTKIFKLYEHNNNNTQITIKDISKLKSVVSVELNKVDVNTVKGIQKLRSQLQKLVCHRTLNTLDEVLKKCGADDISNSYCWSELKTFTFTNNEIKEIDSSIEFVPWLHTLDLSHNQISNIEALSCLSNLKHLNLAYNKLEVIPQFKGQLCSRLRNLILKNNFIEDITGLQSLTNIVVLELSNNCLIEHKVCLSLSHLSSLQWLNLDNNPLTFHPNHRNRTASCLHLNTLSTQFILDHEPLSKTEKKLIGSLHPMQTTLNTNNSSSVMSDSINSTSDRIKKVRQVVIEEEDSPKLNNTPVSSSITLPQPYLETKKQIENLHEQYGESWLNSHSGLQVQNVLGLESSLPLSSSPYDADFTIHSTEYSLKRNRDQIDEKVKDREEASFVTAFDVTVTNEDSDIDDSDFDDEIEGEENIYVATLKGDTEQIFLIITKNHITEKDCSTSKEIERWHLKSIIKCEILNESTEVMLNFDTMRKDKQQRVYVLEEEDVEKFVATVRSIMAESTSETVNNIEFQCMKCSTRFLQLKYESVLSEASITCPNCDSNLVIENSN